MKKDFNLQQQNCKKLAWVYTGIPKKIKTLQLLNLTTAENTQFILVHFFSYMPINSRMKCPLKLMPHGMADLRPCDLHKISE